MFLEKLTIMQSARVFSLHEKTHRETCVFCAYAPKVTVAPQGSAGLRRAPQSHRSSREARLCTKTNSIDTLVF